MERVVEERFERIENNLESASKILQEAVTLSRQNQTTIQQILAAQPEPNHQDKEPAPNQRRAA